MACPSRNRSAASAPRKGSCRHGRATDRNNAKAPARWQRRKRFGKAGPVGRGPPSCYTACMNTPAAAPSASLLSILRKAGLLGSSYVLGAFNDNFFKQAVLLLAVQAGLASLQSWGTLLFALPFVLFSSVAGWLADRSAKKTLVVWAKVIEVAAMLTGAWRLRRALPHPAFQLHPDSPCPNRQRQGAGSGQHAGLQRHSARRAALVAAGSAPPSISHMVLGGFAALVALWFGVHKTRQGR